MTLTSVTRLSNPEVFSIAMRAGIVAIAINTAMLTVADSFGLTTARGGLLKLLTNWLAWGLSKSDNATRVQWMTSVTKIYLFQSCFHIVIGLVMALLFIKLAAALIEQHAVLTGLFAALAVWLINAIVILPALGEGFAGGRSLTAAGKVYFAVAHTAFFLILSLNARGQMLRLSLRQR